MIPESYRSLSRVWVEVSTDIDHGGEGWDYGTCLWSPVTNSAGAKRYQIMEQVQPGDTVLHIRGEPGSETGLRGYSTVLSEAQITNSEPPSAGPWKDRNEYYRIDLHEYQSINPILSLQVLLNQYSDLIRDEIVEDKPKFYPITTHGDRLRTVQGIYLAECTARLYRVLLEALGVEAVSSELTDLSPENLHKGYEEGRRLLRETSSFVRNPQLVRLAKERANGICELCGLNSKTLDSELGHRILECHHLDPLGDRDQASTTTLDRVTVVCANCHRLLHARRPPFELEEMTARLKASLQ